MYYFAAGVFVGSLIAAGASFFLPNTGVTRRREGILLIAAGVASTVMLFSR